MKNFFINSILIATVSLTFIVGSFYAPIPKNQDALLVVGIMGIIVLMIGWHGYIKYLIFNR